jgi:hypothetical protein
MTTTLAMHLRMLFQRFAEHAARSSDSKPISVLNCWRAILFSSELDNPQFWESMSLVRDALTRLRIQVTTSKLLDTQSLQVAVGILDGLTSLMNPEFLFRPVHAYAGMVANDRLGSLGILASTLRIENPETEIPKDELEQLKSELKELLGSITSAGINPNLRAVLLQHGNSLLWAIESVGSVGYQALDDTLAKFAVAANRLTASTTDIDPQRSTFINKIQSFCHKFAVAIRLAETVDDKANALLKIGHDAQNLIHSLPHLSS